MNVSIKTGNMDVIHSGIVASFNNEPIEISLDEESKGFLIRFCFTNDATSEQGLKANILSNPSGIEFLLINFNNPLGTGTLKPIEFAADNNGKKLCISFAVYLIGKSSPTLQYTIYRER